MLRPRLPNVPGALSRNAALSNHAAICLPRLLSPGKSGLPTTSTLSCPMPLYELSTPVGDSERSAALQRDDAVRLPVSEDDRKGELGQLRKLVIEGSREARGAVEIRNGVIVLNLTIG